MPEQLIDSTAQEIVVAARPGDSVLRPFDVAEQMEAMRAYQRGLQSILDDGDWQQAGAERFVKRSGWRKIAAWFGLSIELVRDHVDRADDGSVVRAQIWARAIAPNGRFADGDGYCDVSESRFARNKAKLENDLRGTACTRAINRAISNLVGMGAVSHEEVEASGGPPFGPAVNDAQHASLQRAIAYVLDVQQPTDLIDQIRGKAGGYVPVIAWQAIGLLAAAVKERNDAFDEAFAASVEQQTNDPKEDA